MAPGRKEICSRKNREKVTDRVRTTLWGSGKILECLKVP